MLFQALSRRKMERSTGIKKCTIHGFKRQFSFNSEPIVANCTQVGNHHLMIQSFQNNTIMNDKENNSHNQHIHALSDCYFKCMTPKENHLEYQMV